MHGVSGTPPAALLYTAPVTYDQGWDLAKVYEPNRDDWDVSAFHWGNLTSKSSLSAFWILLAPFAMANVAGWMSDSPNVWSRIWVRVAGLSLTGIFFAQLANMAFDVPLAKGTGGTAVKWIYLGLCLIAVLGIGMLSTQSNFKPLGLGERARYLLVPTIAAMNPMRQEPSWADPAAGCELTGHRMWGVHSVVHRLRRVHLTMGMAVLAVVAARAVGADQLELAALITAGAMLVTLAFTSGPFAAHRLVLAATALAPLAGATVLVGSLATLFSREVVRSNVADDLTYEIALIFGIAAGLGLLGEMLTRGFRSGWAQLGLLAVAGLLGATFGLTGAMLVETYLTESRTTAETFDAGASFVTVAMLGMVVFMGIAFVTAMVIPRQGGEKSAFRRGILRARAVLALTGFYGVAVGAFAVWSSCEGEVPRCTQANIDLPPGVIEDPSNLTVLFGLPFDPTSLLGWAKVLMVAVPAVLIIRSIVGGLLNGQDSRRKVGILWDLGSFWPRWFHPLAPPGYGPYAVTRLQTVLGEVQPDVLGAHSQGALVSVVAISLAPDDAAPRLLITYGSQIGDLYPSLFPAVGFDHLVESTDTQLEGRWLNLWRATDSIGGQVIPSLADRNWEVLTGSGHSSYELTPEFCTARTTFESGDLHRPPYKDMVDCWKRFP